MTLIQFRKCALFVSKLSGCNYNNSVLYTISAFSVVDVFSEVKILFV